MTRILLKPTDNATIAEGETWAYATASENQNFYRLASFDSHVGKRIHGHTNEKGSTIAIYTDSLPPFFASPNATLGDIERLAWAWHIHDEEWVKPGTFLDSAKPDTIALAQSLTENYIAANTSNAPAQEKLGHAHKVINATLCIANARPPSQATTDAHAAIALEAKYLTDAKGKPLTTPLALAQSIIANANADALHRAKATSLRRVAEAAIAKATTLAHLEAAIDSLTTELARDIR